MHANRRQMQSLAKRLLHTHGALATVLADSITVKDEPDGFQDLHKDPRGPSTNTMSSTMVGSKFSLFDASDPLGRCF